MSADLRQRLDAGDLGFLDGLVLLGTMASQRWFAGKSRDVLDARVLDAAVDGEEPPLLAIAVVEVRYGLQSHDLYHLPLGFRPQGEGWRESVVAEADGWTVYDAIADPELARRIVDAMRRVTKLETGEATISFCSVGEIPEQIESVRPMGAEQSNSSLVLDGLALKLYRRLEPGMNPDLEILRFLTERGFEHTAPLVGWMGYEGPPLEATLGLLQEFVPSEGDGWGLTLDSLSRGEADWLPEHAGRLGEVTALLHNALGADATDPHFSPEEPSTEALALLSASIDEEIEQVFSGLSDSDEAVEPVRGRGEEVRDRLRLLTHVGQVGKLIRTHGDYHLGQALWTERGDWIVLDFEGEPARSVPERRRRRSPLRDVAGMLRSFAYAASAASIQRGVEPPADWEERCRAAFLEGYLGTIEPTLLPSGEAAITRLLTVFELEKAVYELRYELSSRPDWVSIPVAGILRMLETEL